MQHTNDTTCASSTVVVIIKGKSEMIKGHRILEYSKFWNFKQKQLKKAKKINKNSSKEAI